ncbi:MAG: CRISPR-associated helicase Cas3' [Methanofastidiosum sp.]|nr:CRISPR-associated helicase Cas3' [Methanofastidiosum sp.]
MISKIFTEENIDTVKEIIAYFIYYHDIGKINPYFQKINVEDQNISGDKRHSFYSSKSISSFLIKKFPGFEDTIYLFSYIIEFHHSPIGNFTGKIKEENKIEKEITELIFNIIKIEKIEIKQDTIVEFWDNPNFEWKRLFLLVKLIYSLLVMSDSYSTFHYTSSLDEFYKLNILDEKTKESMKESFLKVDYNKNIDNVQLKTISGITNINELRREILIECNTQIKKLLEENNRIFMLSVPTGGGKTNISMKLALNILEYDNRVKRIFYVFPFINIIEQNSKVIDRALFNSLLFPNKVGKISDIYSSAYIDKLKTDNDSTSDLQHLIIIKNDNFLNNCVNIITNVNFFNAFIKNNRDNRYKIANLCNSIVIIDEIQSLSDKNLRIFYDFINETSKNLNIYYIIMSATLPNLNYFLDNVKIPQILEDSTKYFNHPLLERNSVEFRYDIHDIEEIKKLVIKEINENYSNKKVKILLTFNVISTSRKVYDCLKEDSYFNNFKIYLLNGTIHTYRRKKIIQEFKIKTNTKNTILVSTQSVEAGMDIDCDFGVRDYSILESLEQISGRINRECDGKKSKISKLYIIKYKDGEKYDVQKIYSPTKSSRYNVLKNFTPSQLNEILKYKKFDYYYKILAKEVKGIGGDSFNSVITEINQLHYKTVNDMIDVIEQEIEQIDIFINEIISLDDLSTEDREYLLAFTEDPDIKRFEGINNIIKDNQLITKNVFEVWRTILSSTDKFEDKYIRKRITSLFNQFIVTINNIKIYENNTCLFDHMISNELAKYDEKYNTIISTDKFLKYYSFEDGIDTNKLKSEICVYTIRMI